MQDKTACSFAFLDSIRERNYYEATRCAHAMLEDLGEVVRHHEMMLTINLRRENIAAALENCNELVSYGRLKGLDVAEYESHRKALLTRLSRTRNFLAGRFWEEVQNDLTSAPTRYATIPLVIAGEAGLLQNPDSDCLFLVFFVYGHVEKQIACRLAPCENPFVAEVEVPRWSAVHCRFLNALPNLVLLEPCHYLGSFDAPVQ